MGLSSFNRMRREKSRMEMVEAERFKIVNGAGGIRAQDEARAKADELLPEVHEAQEQALTNIGEKTLADNDEALRMDHAAEIAGRNLDDVQGEPKDPVDRIKERIPDDTANERLVPRTSVDGKGPTKAMLQAAANETGSANFVEQVKTVPDADPNPQTSLNADGEDPNDNDPDDNEDDDNSADNAEAEIPDDWSEMSAADQKALARNFTTRAVHTKNEAKIVITREIKRREEAAAKETSAA